MAYISCILSPLIETINVSLINKTVSTCLSNWPSRDWFLFKTNHTVLLTKFFPYFTLLCPFARLH